MFCVAYWEEVSLKKGTVKSHIFSGNKHKDSKVTLVRKEAWEHDIAYYLTKCDKKKSQLECLCQWKKGCIELRVVENGLKLTHSSHLSDCIPPLLMQEKEKVCGQLKGTFISCIFDAQHVMGRPWQLSCTL